MYPRAVIPDSLIQLAHSQAGVLTRAQVDAAGIGRHSVARLLNEGRWQRMLSGIYYVHTTPPPHLAQLHAGLLSVGDDGWAYGATALALHAHRAPQLPLTVAHPDAVRRRPPTWLNVIRRPAHDNLMRVRRAQTSTPAQALVEAAWQASARSLVDWADSALATWQCSPREVRELIQPNTRHRQLLLGLCDAAESGLMSELERHFDADVISAHALPQPIRQRRMTTTRGIADATYEEFRLLIQLDGRIGHQGNGRLRDRRRDNQHSIEGWLTLRFGWHDTVGTPCLVASDVEAALRSRGWPGQMSHCPGCLRAA